MHNSFTKPAVFSQNAGGAGGTTSHSISSSISSLWVGVSLITPWLILTKLQPFHSKRAPDESAKVNTSEEALAYERARQQNAREEMSRLKGKAKNIPTGSSVWSKPPAYSPPKPSLPLSTTTTNGASHTPPSTTTIDDASHARALQAQLDNERASYELARQLQAQEEAVRQEHRRLLEEASRVQLFHCAICMEEQLMDFAVPNASCGHILCRECMKNHVQSQVGQSIWPIRCPMCVADHARTEEHGGEYRPTPLDSVKGLSTIMMSVINRDVVETLGVDEAVMTKWVKLEMEKVSVAVECPR